jgi:hypothetical protein
MLRDYEGDKAGHLSEAEREAVIEGIKRRISQLNGKLDP